MEPPFGGFVLFKGGWFMPHRKKKSASELVAAVMKHPAMNLVVIFLVIFMAFVMQQARNIASMENIAIAVTLVFMLFVVLMSVLSNALNLHRQEYLDDKIADLKNIILGSNLSWLVNEKYVSAVERESETSWVFSPFMMNDLQLTENVKTLEENLQKGRKYVFFTADRPRNHKAMADFDRKFDYDEGQVKFYFVPASDFLFVSDMMVFNVGEEKERGIEKLPVVNMQYHMEMDQLHTDRLIGIGRMFTERYKTFKVE
jgi:hypothetical protein